VAIQSGCTEGDFLLVNADEERNFQTTAKILKFGFSELADFKISDANGGENETNFKLNYKGKSVPIWINKKLDLQGVYGILAAFCVGDILGLNVVEMSETLKNI
jgi:UDP-N-acetylmuramyl pentapeptide synthase